MNEFRFKHYDLKELHECGEALVKPLLAHPNIGELRIPSPHWTETILDWFWAARRQDVVVDARAARPLGSAPSWRRELAQSCSNFCAPKGQRETHGEFLFDLAHSTYPSSDADYWTTRYWHKAFDRTPCVLLALESEWGKLSAGEGNTAFVMHDAIKLLHASALAKVVIFASTKPESRADTLKLAEKMVRNDESRIGTTRPSWLWVDVPWSNWPETHAPTWWAGTAGDEQLQARR